MYLSGKTMYAMLLASIIHPPSTLFNPLNPLNFLNDLNFLNLLHINPVPFIHVGAGHFHDAVHYGVVFHDI